MHVDVHEKEQEGKAMDIDADHEGAVAVDKGVDVDAHGDVDKLSSDCCLLCSRSVSNTMMSKINFSTQVSGEFFCGVPWNDIKQQWRHSENLAKTGSG